MNEALSTPLAFGVLQDAVSRFNALRTKPFWQLAVDKSRTLPVNGVSDVFVEKTTLLNRDNTLLNHEISAALEVGYLLRPGLLFVPPGIAGDVRFPRRILARHRRTGENH
ncbi:diguanylate cyclase [Enterobacter cancerogenus]|uniref:Diguanylate cyclase n=1 Tax=Enterobacter cancerogenus TaxID=69218 RepID=A0A484YEI2_9ENTR|nr:diguanylate cyclase [Enterobacter cancerogenus]